MSVLPWNNKTKPLMLAPMQGLTNEALRACYMERYRPDVVFTEFVRVQTQSRKRVARGDLTEIRAHRSETPLVVQLIGHEAAALADAAELVQAQGCRHVNLNLGCPYGRMTTGATGGELLNFPEKLPLLLAELRKVCKGGFSVKCRAGYRHPGQIFDLLPLFEASGVDFLVFHPRTVMQKYGGAADHDLTGEVAARTAMPVVANGDITSAEVGRALLERAGVAGLMLGRGALADPGLFGRIRLGQPDATGEQVRRREVSLLVRDLLPRYLVKFCGERQALMKLKDVLNFIPDECLQRDLKKLKKATSLERFSEVLEKYFQVL